MWIGLSKFPETESVIAAFASNAPGVTVRWGDLLEDDYHDGVLLVLVQNPSEFPFRIDAYRLCELDEYDLGLVIARDLSILLDCSTICDGSRHGPTAAPYWSIVWQQGKAFLADDCNSVFVDGSCDVSESERQSLGPVKTIGPISNERLPSKV